MGYEWQPLNQRLYLLPYDWEDISIVCIGRTQSMHALAEPTVVIGFGLDKAVEGVLDNSTPHDHHADTAHTAALTVGGFEIYGCEVLHSPNIISSYYLPDLLPAMRSPQNCLCLQ